MNADIGLGEDLEEEAARDTSLEISSINTHDDLTYSKLAVRQAQRDLMIADEHLINELGPDFSHREYISEGLTHLEGRIEEQKQVNEPLVALVPHNPQFSHKTHFLGHVLSFGDADLGLSEATGRQF